MSIRIPLILGCLLLFLLGTGNTSMGLPGRQGTPVPILADNEQIPPTEGSQLLRQQLARILKEMRRAQEELREKIEHDILPRLQEEIEKLQEMLKKYRSDEKARSMEI